MAALHGIVYPFVCTGDDSLGQLARHILCQGIVGSHFTGGLLCLAFWCLHAACWHAGRQEAHNHGKRTLLQHCTAYDYKGHAAQCPIQI